MVGFMTILEEKGGLGDPSCQSRSAPSALHGDSAEMLGVNVKQLQTVGRCLGHSESGPWNTRQTLLVQALQRMPPNDL